jgi:hypothetical protein
VITYSIISTLFKLAFKTPNEEKKAGVQSNAEDTAGTNKEADANSTFKQDLESVPQKADVDFKKKSENTKRVGTKKAASNSTTKQDLKKTPKKVDLDFKKKIEDMKNSLNSNDNSE